MVYNCFCQHSCTFYFKCRCQRIIYVPLFMENFQRPRKFWFLSIDVESTWRTFDFKMVKFWCQTNCILWFVIEKIFLPVMFSQKIAMERSRLNRTLIWIERFEEKNKVRFFHSKNLFIHLTVWFVNVGACRRKCEPSECL